MSSAICFNLDGSKILSSGNGLKLRIYWKSGIAKTCDSVVRRELYHSAIIVHTLPVCMISMSVVLELLG